MRILDWAKYLKKASETVSEGVVLLKNENNALPLDISKETAVFGRIQLHYYKSGTGSGGMVNVSKVSGIIDGLIESGARLNSELLDIYRKWDIENPFDSGNGWGGEPWSQKEMPVSRELAKHIAESCETAIVIFGRTAGEEQDAKLEEGSYLLSESEKTLLRVVRDEFKKVIVLLNVGGIIDMEYIEACSPDAVMYVWHGGMTGGTGTADVLTGKISPSGKLCDTIAHSVHDYPSDKYFGGERMNCYSEDIYVGYRWFETFDASKVRYPFGFGLSYTTFDIEPASAELVGDIGVFKINVRNTGEYAGKEVVQLYCEMPQGRLGKPSRVLCGFCKTQQLQPNESESVTLKANLNDIASYDDSGITGNKSCYVLEKGIYTFYIGTDVRSAAKALVTEIPFTKTVKQCRQAAAPVIPFERIRPELSDGKYIPKFENVPLSAVDESERRLSELPPEIKQTGNKGIKLADVMNGDSTLESFIAQLSDRDLSCIIRGEGMGSPKVTAGTASAFGGVTNELQSCGIPCGCCDDGPSGMRFDCGTKAFSIPIGTLLACTFNEKLVAELFEFLGLEMAVNHVECLLGPGMNIHRHPLNGRNFEYFSEDPFLTGKIAAAELRGLHNSGVTGTIKHFCCNNQEKNRTVLDSVVSERALREIYLKGFEIAVKEGNADSVMTSYGSLNGIPTAGNYDLNTVILRDEWGFSGFIMTDWWANVGERGSVPSRTDLAAMTKAQNDVYMVCAEGGHNDDNTLDELAKGNLSRGELQRNAANICRFLMDSNAMKRLTGCEDEVKVINRPIEDDFNGNNVEFHEIGDSLTIDLNDVCTDRGMSYSFALVVLKAGYYKVTLSASSEQSELAQMPVTLFSMGTNSGTFTWNGTNGKPVSYAKEIPMFSHYTSIRLYFAQSGLKLKDIHFERLDKPIDVSALI